MEKMSLEHGSGKANAKKNQASEVYVSRVVRNYKKGILPKGVKAKKIVKMYLSQLKKEEKESLEFKNSLSYRFNKTTE